MFSIATPAENERAIYTKQPAVVKKLKMHSSLIWSGMMERSLG